MKQIKYIFVFLLFLPLTAMAGVNITVPSAPSSGYFLESTSTGQYLATSSPSFSSIYGAGLITCNSSGSNALTYTYSTGLFGCNTISGGGGNSKWATSSGSIITPNGGGGILVTASSTIGNGTTGGGLTIYGSATTTNLTISSIASSSVLFTGAGGKVSSSGDLTFDGSTLRTPTDGSIVTGFLYANDQILTGNGFTRLFEDGSAQFANGALTISNSGVVTSNTSVSFDNGAFTSNGSGYLTVAGITSPLTIGSAVFDDTGSNSFSLGYSNTPTNNSGAILGENNDTADSGGSNDSYVLGDRNIIEGGTNDSAIVGLNNDIYYGGTDYILGSNVTLTGVTDEVAIGFSSNYAYVDSSGNVNAYGFNNISDARLKHNINELDMSATTSLANIMQLNPVTFNYNVDASTTPLRYGFLAQQIQPIYPNFITTDSKGFMSVNYEEFIPVLVKAMQQLYAQVTSLSSRVTALENKADNASASSVVGSVSSPVAPSGTSYYDTQFKQWECWQAKGGHLIYTVGQCK